MFPSFTTSRLIIKEITIEDAPFLFQLMNTPEWLNFIGDMNIHSISDANRYITALDNNPFKNYYLMRLNSNHQPIGIVTLIKRTHFPHYDIGWALPKNHEGFGYAMESAKALIREIKEQTNEKILLASTKPSNEKSIRLIQKLGFEPSSLTHEKELIFEKLI